MFRIYDFLMINSTGCPLMQLTENMVAISFNTSLQKYGGDMAVASMSILNSIMQFVMLLLPGLVQGAQPLLSYNLGAQNISRVKKTFRLLLICCVSGSFLIWLICMTMPSAVTSIFTSDNSVRGVNHSKDVLVCNVHPLR